MPKKTTKKTYGFTTSTRATENPKLGQKKNRNDRTVEEKDQGEVLSGHDTYSHLGFLPKTSLHREED